MASDLEAEIMRKYLEMPKIARKALVSSYPLLSPYTFMSELADMALMREDDTFFAKNFSPLAPENIVDGTVIYCVTDIARGLFDVLRKAKKRVVLIFGRSVYTVDEGYMPFIDECNAAHIFAQNCTVPDPRFTKIPLGHENKHYGNICHPSNSVGLIQRMMEKACFNQSKKEQIYASFSVMTNARERKECLINAMRTPMTRIANMNIDTADEDRQVTFYREMTESRFVLCPWGNGIDTHRYWQSLYMGSIPITRKNSALSDFGDTGGLFIERWDQILDYDGLMQLYSEMVHGRVNKDKIFFEYWKNLFNCKLKELL